MTDADIKPLDPGQIAPDFTLEDTLTGEVITLSALQGEIVVLNFWSGECPWSRHYDAYFARRAPEWAQNGVRLLHVKSNLNETPDDVRRWAAETENFAPVLDDADGRVALAYGAQTTPHVFLIDTGGRIAYQGAVDDRSFRQREATVNYLDAAIAAVRAHRMPDPASTPAYGCAIVREFYEEA